MQAAFPSRENRSRLSRMEVSHPPFPHVRSHLSFPTFDCRTSGASNPGFGTHFSDGSGFVAIGDGGRFDPTRKPVVKRIAGGTLSRATIGGLRDGEIRDSEVRSLELMIQGWVRRSYDLSEKPITFRESRIPGKERQLILPIDAVN